MNEQMLYIRLMQDIEATKEREMSYRALAVSNPAFGAFVEPVISDLAREVITMQDWAAALKTAFPNVK